MSDAGTVKVPGAGPVRKRYVYAVGGVAGAYVLWRWWRSRSAPAAPVDAQVDTGSTIDSGVVGGAASGNVQYAGSTNPSSNPDAILTNAQWTAKAQESLGAVWDPQTIATIAGKIIADVPLTASEVIIAQAILAAAGRPPEGTHTIQHAPTPVPVPGPPATPALRVVQVTKSTITVAWNAIPTATIYDTTVDGARTIKSTTATVAGFSGLKPNSPYRVMIRARNAKYAGGWADVVLRTPAK